MRFDTWKEVLHKDCVAHGKRREFNNLPAYALEILYVNGVAPTVEAIAKDGLNGKALGKPA